VSHSFFLFFIPHTSLFHSILDDNFIILHFHLWSLLFSERAHRFRNPPPPNGPLFLICLRAEFASLSKHMSASSAPVPMNHDSKESSSDEKGASSSKRGKPVGGKGGASKPKSKNQRKAKPMKSPANYLSEITDKCITNVGRRMKVGNIIVTPAQIEQMRLTKKGKNVGINAYAEFIRQIIAHAERNSKKEHRTRTIEHRDVCHAAKWAPHVVNRLLPNKNYEKPVKAEDKKKK
jgi:histone H3/H4